MVGAAGYAGGELLRLLLQHPEVTDLAATSRSQAGKPVAEAHPMLAPLTEARFLGAAPGEIARGRDVVFLCLEHGESSRVAGEVLDADPGLLVDLAADFRVRDLELYRRYYGPHPAPRAARPLRLRTGGHRGRVAPGRPRHRRPRVLRHRGPARALSARPRRDRRGAVALRGDRVERRRGPAPADDAPSGAGAQRLRLLGPGAPARGRSGAVVAGMDRPARRDGPAAHPLGAVRARHLSHAARLPRPLAITDGESWTSAACWYRDAYAGRPFVRVLEAPPELTHAVGTNYALLHACESEDGGEVQVSVAIDNLIKGAGGQAIQAMNLALGLEETMGLRAVGVYPC